MHLIVLAGGLGTRIRSAIGDLPKAIAPLPNSNMLMFQVKYWKKIGFKQFTFLLHYKSNLVIDVLNQIFANESKISFQYVIEPELLGTGGAVKYAISKLNLVDELYITNADTWLDIDTMAIKKLKSPSLVVREEGDISRYGSVLLGDDFIVTAFNEKSKDPISNLINCGFYKLHVQDFLEVRQNIFALEEVILPNLVKKNTLKAVTVTSRFIDIGVPEDYYRFVQLVKAGEV
jgi:D-glycero-alpha-D-manno-heptose 1-phosphate guanylyltransferase